MSEQPIGATIEVRGHSRFERQAPRALLFLAGVVDFLIGTFLVMLIYAVFGIDPLLNWKLAPILAIGALAPWAGANKIFGASLGEAIWKTKEGKTRARELSDNTSGSLLTLAAFGAVCAIFVLKIASHPYWQTPNEERIQPAPPPNYWPVLSIYYTLAPWPVSFAHQPIFYSIPYELGPPQRFVGHIEAEWAKSSVRLSFEGPRTPFEYQSRVRNRASLRDCFTTSPLRAPSCIEVRKLTLERHLQELRERGYAQFELTWFLVEKRPGSTIPDEQRAEGVRIRARAGEKIQDRYILITQQGLHQAISLSYLDDAEGHSSEQDFKTALGALRISDDLLQGRAWANHSLQSTQLGSLPPITDPAYLDSLSQIQALLVSKISVDPEDFQAYYHLAGSYLLLLKHCQKNPNPELKILSQAMIERLDRYAHDVGSRNPGLTEIDRLAQDAKRF